MDDTWPEARVVSRGPALVVEPPEGQLPSCMPRRPQILLCKALSVLLIHPIHPKPVSFLSRPALGGDWSLPSRPPEVTCLPPIPR